MTKILIEEATVKLVLDYLNGLIRGLKMDDKSHAHQVAAALREALAEQPAQQEPVAIKHMMRWVDSLKRQSDYGQHMGIPGLNAGACFELAIELEQFINTSSPAQRTWVGLTDEERYECLYASDCRDALCAAIAAKLKEKNT